MPKPIIIRLKEPEQQYAKKNEEKNISIEDILKGKTFYSEERDSKGQCIGVSVALREAINYAGENGIVVSMPELIAAKIKADKTHEFWQKGYDVQSEENIGIDKKGVFVKSGKPVLLVVHGGGLLNGRKQDGGVGFRYRCADSSCNSAVLRQPGRQHPRMACIIAGRAWLDCWIP